MVLQNIKQKQRESGFTIVELLVVIVVIAILAAITIVSYVNVTSRARAAQAASNANAVQSYAETYNADNGTYPTTLAAFTAGTTSAKLPTTVTVGSTAPTSTNGTNTVQYGYVSGGTGAEIIYYDFSSSSTKTITMGASGTYTFPTS